MVPAEPMRTGTAWGVGRRRLRALVVGLLALYAVASLARVVVNVRAASGNVDFHAYWYAGFLIRERESPWGAFFDDREPDLPVAQPGLSTMPANTAPLVLLLAPTSWLPWRAAKGLWLLVNVVAAGLIPWIAARVWAGYGVPLSREVALVSAVVFAGFLATRNAIGNGQTTLVVLLLGLLAFDLAMWGRHGEVIGGLALGVALSKYSLALPLALMLLYHRRYRALAIGGGVQAAGLLVIAAVGRESPLSVVADYLRVLDLHAGNLGVNPANSELGRRHLTLALTLVLGAAGATLALTRWRMMSRRTWRRGIGVADAHVLALLSVWSLVVGYHGAYDLVMLILPVQLLLHRVAPRRGAGPRGSSDRWIAAALVGMVAVMMLPGAVLTPLLPEWVRWLSLLLTAALVVAFGVTAWTASVVTPHDGRVEGTT